MAKRATLSLRPFPIMAGAMLLSLAGCASDVETAGEVTQYPGRELVANPAPPPPPRKPSPPAPLAAADAPGDLPDGTVGTPADAAPTPAPPAQVAALPPPSTTPLPSPGSFERLLGLDQPHMTALLGEPRLRSDAPPATIWRYAGQQCELDVYFYLDLQSQAMRALHYEVRSHEPSERPSQRCYDELVGERHAGAGPAAGADRPR